MSTLAPASRPAAAPTSDAPPADAPPAPRPATRPAPTPLRPLDGAPVEAGGATFAWTAVPGATGYNLQIAADRAFGTLRLDLPLGDATELTVFGQLPEDGRSWFWRIRASDGPWSAPAHFHATGPDAVIAHAEAARAAELAARKAAARTDAPAPAPGLPPYRTGTTSTASIAFVASLAVLAILMFVFIIVLGGAF